MMHDRASDDRSERHTWSREPSERLLDSEAGFLRVPLRSLKTSAVTGFDIYLKPPSSSKHILYRDRRLVFDEAVKWKLQQSDVYDIYIEAADRRRFMRHIENDLDQILSDPDMPLPERSRLVYECGRELVREILEKPWLSTGIERSRQLIQNTVDHLLRSPDHVTNMFEIMLHDLSIYTHSVNVSILGVALGATFGIGEEELLRLGEGLLLHDVGKSEIDPAILNRTRPLTEEEWGILKTHPERGTELLKRSRQVGEDCLAVVMQHHEKCSGRGYPLGLKASAIHPYAKFASLVNVFDNLITPRSDGSTLSAYTAIRLMQSDMRNDFDSDSLRGLILLLGPQ